MSRRGIQVIIQLFYIFPVIAVGATQPKKPFLKDRVLFNPETNGQAYLQVDIADTAQAFIAPAPGLTAGQIVRGKGPGLAVCAVIFPHGRPLALAQVGSPFFPGRVGKALIFCIHIRRLKDKE
jgi:hypothetical protein